MSPLAQPAAGVCDPGIDARLSDWLFCLPTKRGESSWFLAVSAPSARCFSLYWAVAAVAAGAGGAILPPAAVRHVMNVAVTIPPRLQRRERGEENHKEHMEDT